MRCDPSQLFGVWACEASYLRGYVEIAKAADLVQLRAEAAKAAAAAPTPARRRYELTSDGIAVVSLNGPLTKHPHSFQDLLGGTSMVAAQAALRDASRASDVDGIMLVVDSPGGTVAGGAELAAAIRRARERKPLHAFADDLAASGGLLALAQGSKVWAGPASQVGSIGVYTIIEDTSGAYAQQGVRVHVVSSAPPIKGAGVDGTEVTPEQLAELGRRVTDLADWFVGEVAQGRSLPKAQVAALATGQVWIAGEAQARGLVDEVATFEEAMAAFVSGDVDRALDERVKAEGRSHAFITSPPPPAPRPPVPPTPAPRTSAELWAEIEAKALETRPGQSITIFLQHEGAELYRQFREREIAEQGGPNA